MSSTVIVAGAGIGGLTAAIALRRAGKKVVVLERAPELAVVGAGLLLQRNALKALHHVGLMERAIETGEPTLRAELADPAGRPLTAVESSALWGDMKVPVVAFHRADLHRLLLEAAGPLVRTGARVEAFEELGELVRVRLEGGEVLEGAALIGADGLRSAVRRQLLGDEEPRYSGQTSWRAVAPPLSGVPRGVSNETLGPGLRFGYSQVGRGRTYWYAVQTAPAGGKLTVDETRAHLLSLFGGWHAPIRELLEATPAGDIVRTDIFDRAPTTSWGRGRVTLLGDAAHPMTPNLGQGACQAIEDAVVLADSVKHADDLVQGLRDYERRRIPRANKFVVDSRRMGKLLHVDSPTLGALRNWVVRRTPASIANRSAKRVGRFELE